MKIILNIEKILKAQNFVETEKDSILQYIKIEKNVYRATNRKIAITINHQFAENITDMGFCLKINKLVLKSLKLLLQKKTRNDND